MNQAQAAKFVQVWQSSNSVREVAEQMQMSESTASNWATKLRKQGVPLRKYKATGEKLDIEALKAIVEKSNDHTGA